MNYSKVLLSNEHAFLEMWLGYFVLVLMSYCALASS